MTERIWRTFLGYRLRRGIQLPEDKSTDTRTAPGYMKTTGNQERYSKAFNHSSFCSWIPSFHFRCLHCDGVNPILSYKFYAKKFISTLKQVKRVFLFQAFMSCFRHLYSDTTNSDEGYFQSSWVFLSVIFLRTLK